MRLKCDFEFYSEVENSSEKNLECCDDDVSGLEFALEVSKQAQQVRLAQLGLGIFLWKGKEKIKMQKKGRVKKKEKQKKNPTAT